MLSNKEIIKIIKKWLEESLNLNEMQTEYYIKLLEMKKNKSGRYKILYLRSGYGCVVFQETTDLGKKGE